MTDLTKLPEAIHITEDMDAWIDLEKFYVGSSVFIPCIAIKKVMMITYKFFRLRGIKVTIRETTENGLLGLRVWRLENAPDIMDDEGDDDEDA